MRALATLALLLAASPAAAGDLAVVKMASVLADGVDALTPHALPGASVEYRLTVTNPLTGLLTTVAGEVVTDTIDPGVKLNLTGPGGAGAGPVSFEDGNLLGLGLVGSGLGYSYRGLSSMTDGLDFYDGASWGYVPIADADGCDPRVRAIRVRLSGSQTGATSYRLRYLVVVR